MELTFSVLTFLCWGVFPCARAVYRYVADFFMIESIPLGSSRFARISSYFHPSSYHIFRKNSLLKEKLLRLLGELPQPLRGLLIYLPSPSPSEWPALMKTIPSLVHWLFLRGRESCCASSETPERERNYWDWDLKFFEPWASRLCLYCFSKLILRLWKSG